jgi:iron complex outermembrane receptor protein
LSLQVDWTVGRFTITSISAYRSWKNKQVRDGDFRGGSPTFVNTGIAAGDNLSHDFGTLNFDQVTQELRIASPTGQFLEYVGGLYYYFTREGDYFNRRVVQCTASTLPVNAAGLRPCAPGASTYLSRLGEANFGTELENYAAFGQATMNFTPSLRAIGGLRWTHDSVDYKHSRVSPSTVAFPGVQPSFSSVGSTAHNGISGKAGLQYDLTDRVMAYASYTRGYKGPAINVFFNMQPNDTRPIAPETSNAYEVGLKSRLLDGRLVLNLAGFHTVYDNFQANFFDTVAGQVITRLTNAGTVSTRGVEADFTLMPVERLRFTGGIAYTDAHIDQFNCPAPAAANCADAVNGKPLPFSPKFKTSITADYLIPLPAAPFDVELNSAYVWQSKQQYDINQAPDSVQESYGLWDASVSLVSHDERYRLSFVAKNITDQFFTIIKVPNGTFTRQIVPRDAERYVGVNLRVSF